MCIVGISEEESGARLVSGQSLQPTPDKQHKRLHTLPSTDSQEGLKLNLYVSQEDLSVEILSDEEESQTLGLGTFASLPSSASRVSPIGGETLKLDPSSVPLKLTSEDLSCQIRELGAVLLCLQ